MKEDRRAFSDFRRQSVWFWDFRSGVLAGKGTHWGNLNVTHRLDSGGQLASFSEYSKTLTADTHAMSDAISFGTPQYGTARGSSVVEKNLPMPELDEVEGLVLDVLLYHLREQCGATVDYDRLKDVFKNSIDQSPFWTS